MTPPAPGRRINHESQTDDLLLPSPVSSSNIIIPDEPVIPPACSVVTFFSNSVLPALQCNGTFSGGSVELPIVGLNVQYRGCADFQGSKSYMTRDVAQCRLQQLLPCGALHLRVRVRVRDFSMKMHNC